MKEKNDYGEKLEKELFNSSKKKEIYQKGVKNAENYSLYYYVVPLVYIVIIALALALTNQIFNYYSLNYYLFYIGFYFTLYECGNNFLKIITSELEKIKAQKSYVQNL